MANLGGYAGRLLRVDLTAQTAIATPTSDYVADFLGGRGIATRIYWEEVGPQVGALDPENRLIFITGPATGITPAGARWQIYGKSPGTVPEGFCYTNLGGSWGAFLKAAGFDGIVVHGRSDKPAYLFVRDGAAEIRDASFLWGKGAVETRSILKEQLGQNVRLAAIGPAGENRVLFSGLIADDDASGAAGFGAVMGAKNLKAIAVTGSSLPQPADRQRLHDLTACVRQLLGSTPRPDPVLEVPPGAKRDVCYACIGCDMRTAYETSDGSRGKLACGAASFYQELARRHYGQTTEVPFHVERLCDDYGVDVYAIASTMTLLARCAGAGLISEQETGIPLSRIGSLEFMETLLRKIAAREGVGEVLAMGPVRAAESLGATSRGLADGLTCDSLGHVVSLDPRLLLYTGIIYAMEPRYATAQTAQILGRSGCLWSEYATGKPGAYLNGDVIRVIARRFWGEELAGDFSTYDGKALSAKMVQDRVYSSDCLILCLWMFPISDSEYTEDHVGDPTIESRLLSAVIGQEVSEEDLNHLGERIVNLQRAIMLREGRRGRESDRVSDFYHTKPLKMDWTVKECLVPGKNGEVISRKGAVLDREKFEEMKSEFYALRGWDVPSGLLRKARLAELGLNDVSTELESRGLAL